MTIYRWLKWGGALGVALGLGLLSADARADAMCGGPKRRPDPPPSSSSSPPPKMGARDSGGEQERVASRPPYLPVELGMFGCMVVLGGAAGVASRGKKREEK